MPEIVRPDGARIHYEVHGEGDPVICLGGWGSFCHGETGSLPFGLLDRYQVAIDLDEVSNMKTVADVARTLDRELHSAA